MSRKHRRRQLAVQSKAIGQDLTPQGGVLANFASGDGSFTPPSSWPVGWWQQGFRIPVSNGNAAVEACVGAISQTIASLPIYHYKEKENGELVRIKNSAAARVLRRPNSYQTRADFILNLVRNEQMAGNGIAVGTRNGRFEIDSLHLAPPRSGLPYIADDGSIFYGVGMTELMPEPPLEGLWPARDVLHIRMHAPRHPLMGETPVAAAMSSVMAGNSITGHMSSFFENMARPSGFLAVPGKLGADLSQKLREEWQRAYSQSGSGRVAVLQGGVDWKAMSISSVDAQLIESYRMTIADVARVYRVPLTIIGEMTASTYASTEALINHWLSTGLGFMLEHIELAFDMLFELPPDEFIAFDVDYLMRTDFKTRIEGLVRGVQGGVYAPNEARIKEGLKPVPFGDEPRVQAQVVPLSAAGAIPSSPASPASPSADPPNPDDTDTPDPEADPQEDETPKASLDEMRQRYLRVLFNV